MPTKAEFAKIHIAKKELGLDDDTYRDILQWKFKVSSAKDLNPRQTGILLAHFRAQGWRPKRTAVVKQGRKGKKRLNDNYRKIKPGPAAKQQRKVLAMWAALGYEIKKLDTRCRKQFGIERIEWVTEHEHLRILICDLEERCLSAGVETR